VDVEETLANLRLWVKAALLEDRSETETDAAELFEALDGWLSTGGFPPYEWRQRQQEPL